MKSEMLTLTSADSADKPQNHSMKTNRKRSTNHREPKSFSQTAGMYVPALTPIDATKTSTQVAQPATLCKVEPALDSIESDFTRDGYVYRQIERFGMVAVFQKRKQGQMLFCYDVVVIQRKSVRNAAGDETSAFEMMPSPDQWGEFGFSETTLEAAGKRFAELVSRQRQEVQPEE